MIRPRSDSYDSEPAHTSLPPQDDENVSDGGGKQHVFPSYLPHDQRPYVCGAERNVLTLWRSNLRDILGDRPSVQP